MCSSFRGRSKTTFARAVKNFRKEVERCHRLWEKGGAPRFYRATTPEEIARVYSVLEEQQSARHAALGSKYVLDEPAYRAFYERLAMDGSEAELAALFAVEAQGEIIATLFGIVHDGAFTLLRISTAGHAWGHLSPGTARRRRSDEIFRRARRAPLRHGVSATIRSNAGFGVEDVPLYDLIVARDLSALPGALFHRLKGRLRQNKLARAVYQRFRPDLQR